MNYDTSFVLILAITCFSVLSFVSLKNLTHCCTVPPPPVPELIFFFKIGETEIENKNVSKINFW